jgi:hypothetical protein
VWSASRPGRLYPRERPGTHCTGGWVGPRAGLDRCGKSRSPDLPARSESLHRLSYPGSDIKRTRLKFGLLSIHVKGLGYRNNYLIHPKISPNLYSLMCVARIGDFSYVWMDIRRIFYCLSNPCYQISTHVIFSHWDIYRR